MHVFNLLIFLSVIILIDTDGINPQNPLPVRIAQMR
jgi:hypothetical protein